MYAKQMFNDKLEYLFKSKTKMRVAINMGVIKHAEWDGIFYFEKLNSEQNPERSVATEDARGTNDGKQILNTTNKINHGNSRRK